MSPNATTTPRSSKCPKCGTEHARHKLEELLFTCPSCGHYFTMPSRARIAMLADAGTFREFHRDMNSVDPLNFQDTKPYRDRFEQAQRETGVNEAVTTGLCAIKGQPAVLVIFDFEFLGGTMGSVVGEKIAHAFEEATRRRVPVVSVAASGGARMQEGMLSLMQMAKVAAAVSLHDRKRLAFISIMTDPTFGGVSASFASLGDIILAETGAQIGFVGPRVIEQTTGVTPPKDSHNAETLLRAGLIDLVVNRSELPGVIASLVSRLKRKKAKFKPSEPLPETSTRGHLSAWEQVALARRPGRPTSRYYIARMTSDFLELHGDRWNGDDPAVVGGLAELDGQTIVIVGQERGGTPEEKKASHDGMAYSEGYRKSMRLMQLAAKFGIPVVTLIDCPGAQASCESEHRGIAHALARNLAGMAMLPTPVVSVVIGEGGSGGALALGVADRVLMLEHAIYSVISPEGAAAILFRDSKQAEVISEALKITAHDLHRLSVIDTVVPESEGGAHVDPALTAHIVKNALVAALGEVSGASIRKLLSSRYQKHRSLGRVERPEPELATPVVESIPGVIADQPNLVAFRPMRASRHRDVNALAPEARRQAHPAR